jgi:hypothetical protein
MKILPRVYNNSYDSFSSLSKQIIANKVNTIEKYSFST